MVNCKVQPTCLFGTFIGLVDALKGNYFCLYFELQEPSEGSFNYRDLWWVNK